MVLTESAPMDTAKYESTGEVSVDSAAHLSDTLDEIAQLNLGQKDLETGGAWMEGPVLNVRAYEGSILGPDLDIKARRGGSEGGRWVTITAKDRVNMLGETEVVFQEGHEPYGSFRPYTRGKPFRSLSPEEIHAETTDFLDKLRDGLTPKQPAESQA